MYQSNNFKECKVDILPIELRKKDYSFVPVDHKEVNDGIFKKIPLEKILKHIHHKFHDEGLVYSLIHRIYDSDVNEIEYYVPELVYIAVKKKCRPMCRVLVDKAAKNESLRRLILWNLKAFTVLIKEKDEGLKIFICELEDNIVKTVENRNKFNFSEKAIAMLTTASLILKKMPKEHLKEKLKKFIRRYNYEILNNLQHTIIIPFRKVNNEDYSSNYVCRIVEDNCSCFPTRKRVPYRIILETVDSNEIKMKQDQQPLLNRQAKPAPDLERDLYQQVFEEVEKEFLAKRSLIKSIDHKYPFVVDNEEFLKITELTRFAKKIEDDEKEENKNLKNSKIKITRKETMRSRVNLPSALSLKMDDNVVFRHGHFEIKDNEQLRKFEAIYIPTLPSNIRSSDCQRQSKGVWIAVDSSHKKRFSERRRSSEDENVKIIEEDVKYEGNLAENVWGDPWDQTIKKLKYASPFRKYSSLRFRNVVVKGGDDLRQEIICMQLIYKMQSIMRDASLDIFIKPYEIIVLSQNSGMLEFVSNSISIDAMKKEKEMDLPEFYSEVFNTEPKFLAAKTKFVRSLAGSSILTYVLRLKDRHNGNILIDNEGNIIHIDFGFILGMSPGGLNFESSPFKLTEEYVLLLGGKSSPDYNYFEDLFCQGMQALRERLDEICLILEIMMEDSDLDCFMNFNLVNFRKRLEPDLSSEKFKSFCQGLVDKSYMNSRTVHYDTFQKITNGIMP